MKKALAQFKRLTTIAFQTAAVNTFLSQVTTCINIQGTVNYIALLEQISKVHQSAENPLQHYL